MLPPIKHCKICFKPIQINEIARLFDKDICICHSCQKELEPKFISFNVDSYHALAIYDYSEFIKQQIYLFKGCFDYEMKDVFLNLFIKELRIRYKGYKMVPAPSYKEDNEIRGFNHVLEVFKQLNLEMLKVVEKTAHYKQAEHGAKKRKQIRKHLRLTTTKDMSKNKLLIVDDIYTTGSTIRAMINLLEKLNPKDIKVLVLAKTKSKEVKKI